MNTYKLKIKKMQMWLSLILNINIFLKKYKNIQNINKKNTLSLLNYQSL